MIESATKPPLTRTRYIVHLESGQIGVMPTKLYWFTRAAGNRAGGQVICGGAGECSSLPPSLAATKFYSRLRSVLDAA